MDEEKKYVLNAFRTHFEKFKNKKLVIYGIGMNTMHILDQFKDYNFVGLMDEVKTGESIFGKPIITKEQVLGSGVDTIIIVARTSNVRIIYRRIAEFCASYSISVYDINGNLLGTEATQEKPLEQYRNICMETLKDKINQADVVSFDIFDTLIMRRVLYPRDIFLIVAENIDKSDPFNELFADTRAGAEMDLLGEGKNPNIHEIYDRIQQLLKISDEKKEHWKALELQVEEDYLIPRGKMCSALEYALSTGKEVFLVSDMYLPSDVLFELLGKLGIQISQSNILVSCDYGMFKSNGLFNILRSKAVGKRILHVGDNPEADGHFAKVFGIDDIFQIKSAVSMLEDSYSCELLRYDTTLYSRLLIGKFISVQLVDPFIFSATQGKFLVESNYDMAYSFLAPMICCFFGWMLAKAKELRLDYIFFGARDGFIMDEISKLIRSEIPEFPPTLYFYTSRAATVLAGIDSDEDILYASHIAFAGPIDEMLKTRFMLTDVEILKRGKCSDDEYVLKHKVAIMKRAKTARNNYLRYIEDLPIKKDSRIGFFDFVSSGTSQKGLSRIAGYDLYGLYFSQIYDSDKKDLKIDPMFGVHCAFEKSYHLIENFFFWENIFTSYEPTLKSFDELGQPVFMVENRTAKQFASLKEIHSGILDYVSEMKNNICHFSEVDKALPDHIYQMLQNDFSIISTDYYATEALEDAFCNRTFVIGED